MRFKHATWLKLYRDEEGAFARLPFTARAYAKQLLLLCDDAGRIDVGEGEDHVKLLVDTAGFRMGATRGDRRMMALMFPLLFEEQYLVRRGRFVVVRNFVAAQRRWSDDEDTTASRPSDDGATTEQPTDHEAATKLQPSSNDAATKQELTPQNHDGDDASARARARSSVPSSSETIPSENPSAPSDQLALLAADSQHAGSRQKQSEKTDGPIPPEGTPARAVWEVLSTDPELTRCVPRPAALAVRLADPGAFPALNVVAEVKRAAVWLAANPKNRKKDGARFLANWLTRAQDRAPRVTAAPSGVAPIRRSDALAQLDREMSAAGRRPPAPFMVAALGQKRAANE